MEKKQPSSKIHQICYQYIAINASRFKCNMSKFPDFLTLKLEYDSDN